MELLDLRLTVPELHTSCRLDAGLGIRPDISFILEGLMGHVFPGNLYENRYPAGF